MPGRLNTIWFRIGVIFAVIVAGALWLYSKGPIPVIRGSTPLREIVPFWYMLLAFPALGMLTTDFIQLWARYKMKLQTIELGAQLILLILLSNLRLSAAIPLSGHSVLFGYLIFRRLTIPFPGGNTRKIELFVTLAIFASVIYMKLIRWNDPMTLLFGVVIGIIMGLVSYYLANYHPASVSC
jgi:hypothetical protein